MDIGSVVVFSFAVVGLTNIIVDPAAIFAPIRDLIDRSGIKWLSKLVSCYQCTGTWAGFICGYLILGSDPEIVICSGMAGSFIATFSAIYSNYLEARSMLGVDEDE